MNKTNFDEKTNYIMAEIDKLSSRVKFLETVQDAGFDASVDESSLNAVQNVAIFSALSKKAELDASNFSSDFIENWQNALNFEKIKIIYDKDSADININWGLKNGINGGVSVSNKDFSNFNRLIVFVVFDKVSFSFLIDLSFLNSVTLDYNGSGCGLSTTNARALCRASVSSAKTTFTNEKMGYIAQGSVYFTESTSSTTYVYKIVGIY